jgi:hypothetical protein
MTTIEITKKQLIDAVLHFGKGAFYGFIVAALLWVAICTTIFQFRHPWATKTETFLHMPDAFLLRKVPYSEMRDHE